jgi:Protein N-terminal asparagine amidohydrolase
MPLTVRGSSFHAARELFEKCNRGDPHKYALELQNTRYSYDQIPKKGEKVGTIDATSCIGIVYRTGDQTTYVQHHDGRSLETLVKIFDKKNFRGLRPIEVTLIGGCKKAGKNGGGVDEYSSLEKYTKENIEKLVKFWHESAFNIDVQGWAIGDGGTYETLCSDFVAGDEGIYLIKQGEIGTLNLKMKGTLLPQLPRRLATTFSDHENYFFVNPHSQKSLQLSRAGNIHFLKQFAEHLLRLDDATLLKACSTTPGIEPPYYPKMMREMASYVLSHQMSEAIEVPLLQEHAVFGIQGEIVKIQPQKTSKVLL